MRRAARRGQGGAARRRLVYGGPSLCPAASRPLPRAATRGGRAPRTHARAVPILSLTFRLLSVWSQRGVVARGVDCARAPGPCVRVWVSRGPVMNSAPRARSEPDGACAPGADMSVGPGRGPHTGRAVLRGPFGRYARAREPLRRPPPPPQENQHRLPAAAAAVKKLERPHWTREGGDGPVSVGLADLAALGYPN